MRASGCPIRIIACGCKMNSEGQDSMELIIRSNNNKTKSNSHSGYVIHLHSLLFFYLLLLVVLVVVITLGLCL